MKGVFCEMSARSAIASVSNPFDVQSLGPASELRLAQIFDNRALGELVRGTCEDYLVRLSGLRATDWSVEQLGCGVVYLVPVEFAGVSSASAQLVPGTIRLSGGGRGPHVEVLPRVAGIVVTLVTYAAMIGVYANGGFERMYNLVREYARSLPEAEEIAAIVD